MQTHHAKLVRSDDPLSYIPAAQKEEEVRLITSESFGVDDARSLQQIASRTPESESILHIVVRFSRITIEVQNALLKTLEEPAPTTHISLVTHPHTSLLPTVLSRLEIGKAKDASTTAAWGNFLQASYAERLSQIDTWNKKKDDQWLSHVQQGLMAYTHTVAHQPTPLLNLVTTRLNTRGASNKMLLEALSLTLTTQ